MPKKKSKKKKSVIEVKDKAYLIREACRLDPSLKNKVCDAELDATILLLGAVLDGPYRANKTAQIPEIRRRKYMKNLKRNGVFVGNKITSNWDSMEDICAFMFDVNIAMGYINRTEKVKK